MRHHMIAALIVLAVTSTTAFAEDGDTVFLDYTQAELDRNYDQAAWAPNIRQILARYDWKSALTRDRLGEPERFSYGESEVEGFDFFRAEAEGAPLHIFIHGGAWRAGSAESYHFPAEMFVDSGISYAALDFGAVQDIGLDGMIGQIRDAIAWIHDNSADLGIDSDRIYISGHSSGAHLAGVVAATDWSKFGLPEEAVKGALLISGMYDLKPVRLSARSSYVPFTDAIEDEMSPARHVDEIVTPLIIAYGTLETDEFQRHSREFAGMLEGTDLLEGLIVAEHFNHFELVEDFANPFGVVGAAALAQIRGE